MWSTVQRPRTTGGWVVIVASLVLGTAAVAAEDGAPAAADERAGSPAGETPPASAAPRFDVWEFAISGNTRLDRQAVERTVYPFLGPSRSVADVENARRALEAAYRDAGFGTAVVTIPEQDVDEGVVRLEVTEGRIERLVVSGARWFSPEQIRNAVPALDRGRIPELPVVQRELIALNAASSDRRITPVLRPGRSPGTIEAELKVEDRLPLHGSLELSNRYTRDTTRTRAGASLGYDNLWQRQHSLSLGYQTAPQDRDDVTVLFGTYSARLGASPWLLSGYYVDSDTAVSTVGTLGVIGTGQIAGVRFIRPLPPLADGYQRLTFGIDHKDFDESIALLGNQPAIETPIRYTTLSAGWAVTFPGETRNSELGLTAVFATSGLGNDRAEFDSKRVGASPSFAYLTFNWMQERALWRETRLRVALQGQVAGGPLVSNEQFSFGGATSVRGYLESQQFADDGLSAQLEWSTPDWGRAVPGVSAGRLFGFIDAGTGRLQDALPEQDDDFFLWSAGLGLRAALWRSLIAQVEWAVPLEDSGDEAIEAGDDRWHFHLRWAF